MSAEHFRKLERMYDRAPINEHFDPELTVADGEAELAMPVEESHFHAGNAVHGSVYFKALDDAAFFAASSTVEDAFVVTTDFNTYFERPASSGSIRAEGEVLNDNPEQLIAGAVARDEEGNELARGTGTFRKSSTELTPEVGYE